MPDVTQLLDAAAVGDPKAAAELLPLVYDELRKLAAARMTAEAPGHTLQPTALVHEAYLRLVGDGTKPWDSRGHFFAAAAEAMRRIVVEAARRKSRVKHGGGRLPPPGTRGVVRAGCGSGHGTVQAPRDRRLVNWVVAPAAWPG